MAIVLGAGLGFSFLFRPPPEPLYRGKTITEWIFLYDADGNKPAQQSAAQEAFLHFKEDALPVVVRILKKREEPKPIRTIKTLAVRLHLIAPPRILLYEWQLRAGRTVAFLGFNANVDVSDAVPELAYHLTNTPSQQGEFAYDLAHAGPAGIAVLTNASSNPSPLVREEAVLKLLLYPEDSTSEVAGIVLAATQDSDPRVRVAALLRLAQLQRFRIPRGPTNEIVSQAIRCCSDPDSEVRKWAVDLLGNYLSVQGVQAAVTNLLEDPDHGVRTRASEVLRRSTESTPAPTGASPSKAR